MSRRIRISVVLCIIMVLFGSSSEGMGSKQNPVIPAVKKETAKAKLDKPSLQYDTYISKYGFSVTYPKKRYLKEEGQKVNFVIYYYKPNDPDMRKYGDGNTIVFVSHQRALAQAKKEYERLYGGGFKLPDDQIEKIRVIADLNDVVRENTSDVVEKLQAKNLMICLYYREGRPLDALFYLPEKDVLFQVFLETEYDYDEFKSILKSISIINK
jgi:hypothetical protein